MQRNLRRLAGRPQKIRIATIPAKGPNASAVVSKSKKLKDPDALTISRIAAKSPKSPTRVVKKAFFPALAAEGFSNQKPINRYEQSPTSSQPM